MGKVFLIGAGPGDPELMTLKAARALARCDVVLVDDLVHRGCLAHARPGARIVDVGKRGGRVSASQVFIERTLIASAKQGLTVARLKGGDPFVFGRGGEELEALRAHGIEVEVIPGVTAGTAVPAALGIPVTHRDYAHGVTFLTGRTTKPGTDHVFQTTKSGTDHDFRGTGVDWAALVRSRTTLVIYMGLKNLPGIVSSLIAAGMDPATPACLIENGTLYTQRHLVTTLGRLSGEGFKGPALIVIGDVVRFAQGFDLALLTTGEASGRRAGGFL